MDAQANADEEFEEKPDPSTLRPDLYLAAKANDTAAVNKFLEDEVPPDFVDELNGWTALHWAAMSGNVTMVKQLLAKGASVQYHIAFRARMAAKQAIAAAAAAAGNHNSSSSRVARRNSESSAGGDVDGDASVGDNESIKHASASAEPVLEALDEEETEAVMPFLKNTPLLWAAFKGHLRVVWLLIMDGYSPNDTDDMGNNALHLASVNQHTRVLKVLVDDGGSANAVNFYKNRPIDMATRKEIREMLQDAMREGASYTDADVALRHEINLRLYNQWTTALTTAIAEARKIETARIGLSNMNIPNVIQQLSGALLDGQEWSLDEDLIAEAEKLLTKIEAIQDLIQDSNQLQRCLPLRTQREYIDYVHKLERSVEKAKSTGLDRTHLQFANDLVARCNVEYWLETMATRLRAVPIAKDCHEHDMNRLRAAIQKAQALKASDELVDAALILHGRLSNELGLYRAMQAVPAVRLPVENPAEGYWQESDTGHIEETEDYPLPPTDTGVYVWIHSESYTALANAIDVLKKILAASVGAVSSEGAAVNPQLIHEAKDVLTKAEKDMKQMDIKDGNDKAVAIEAATKLAKKLKKKSPKKKKE